MTAVRHRRTQAGLGFWGWLLFVGLVGTMLMFGFRILPHVMYYRTVAAVLDQMHDDPGLAGSSRRDLRTEFERRLRMNNVNEFDFENNLVIKATPKETSVQVAYEVREPIYQNLFFLLDFDKSVVIGSGG